MRCEDATVDIGSSLNGELDAPAEAQLSEHLSGCPDCRREFAALREVWRGLGEVRPETVDSAAMRRRFAAMLDAFQSGGDQARVQAIDAAPGRVRWSAAAAWGGAIAASLLLGLVVGRGGFGPAGQLTADARITSEMAALRRELHDTRQMVTLSLLQQTSASERLKGVSSTGHLDDPGADVIGALLDVLVHDPNVNVRLASIDALARFIDQPVVRRGVVQALSLRTSPLVQIALIDFLVQARERTSLDALRQIAADPAQDASVRGRATWGVEQLS
jgi:HEAT repeat protein/putative zinc finger protein